MLKSIIALLIISLFHTINAQIDPSFCMFTPVDNRPIPKPNITQKYQASLEKNSAKLKLTSEIREYYDGENNFGLSITVEAGLETYVYSYYDYNILELVQGNLCISKKLNESYDLSSFYVFIDADGKEHIISGLGYLLNGQIPFASLGSQNVIRGIPVREWGACFYDDKQKATVKLTISFSNEDKWTPAYPIEDFMSIPIQYKIETKTTSGEINTIINSITQFRPTLFLDEEAYTTKPGVYCQGRAPGKPVPDVPKQFSYIVHRAQSTPGTNDLFGNLRVLAVEHDYAKKLHRYNYGENGIVFTEIHDDDTGLRYKINNNLNKCEITELTNINDAEISPADFFKFNLDPPFQYVGKRRVRGINCDVWIAPRDRADGTKATLEWYFMADGWVVQETSGVFNNQPILLREDYSVKDDQGFMLPVTTFYELSNFDQSRNDIRDFDVSRCDIANKHYRFTINTTSQIYSTLRSNQGRLRIALIEEILKSTKLPLIRVSGLETIYDDGVIYVLFTLLEKPSFIGNKNRTTVDITLEDAAKSLEKTIQSGLNFVIDLNPPITVSVAINSLLTLETRNGRYVYQYIDNGKTTGYSGGSVAGFIIGFLIIGLLIGLVGGVFLILKRSSEIRLPGPLSFFNPNFESSSANPKFSKSSAESA